MSQDTHLTEEQLATLAFGTGAFAEGDGPERAEAEAHAQTCAACAKELHRAVRLAELMGTLATPPPPAPKAMARTQARVRALLAAEPRPEAAPSTSARSAGLVIAAMVLVSVMMGFAMVGPSISVGRLLTALATIGVAALLPSFALRSEREALTATIGALALSLGLAWLDYNEYPMIEGHTFGCMQIELAIGALPLVSMLAFARGTGARFGSLAAAAAGASGALAGQGVLLTSCAADESVAHVLVFHVIGVAIATVGGAILGGALGATRAR